MPPTNSATQRTHTEHEYVLGTHDAELTRLGFQHQVWRAQAYSLWELAGFAPGQTLLDIGCGPGFTTFDLAQLVGPAGRIRAIDQSARYIEHLKAQKGPRGLSNIEASVGDVQAIDVPPASLDGAYTRWVLCFVPDPNAVIAGVARALRPGAALAVQDYSHYRAMTLAPRSAAFERVIQAVDESWRQQGGDPDVGSRLPGMMERHGLRVREIRPLVRLARPRAILWNWPATFFHVYLPTLVERGFITAQEKLSFDQDWAERTADPASFFITPQMVDIVAIKS